MTIMSEKCPCKSKGPPGGEVFLCFRHQAKDFFDPMFDPPRKWFPWTLGGGSGGWEVLGPLSQRSPGQIKIPDQKGKNQDNLFKNLPLQTCTQIFLQ